MSERQKRDRDFLREEPAKEDLILLLRHLATVAEPVHISFYRHLLDRPQSIDGRTREHRKWIRRSIQLNNAVTELYHLGLIDDCGDPNHEGGTRIAINAKGRHALETWDTACALLGHSDIADEAESFLRAAKFSAEDDH